MRCFFVYVNYNLFCNFDIRVDNLKAIKLYSKLGFIKEGLLINDIKDGKNFYDTFIMSYFIY
ncbi:hypothetical protein CLTEP_07760 [Clostridium tepidiprofundi DSM 19306]|uniref:Uncharacterized protein n=1 Tax=Clostridium tepidiprofundi DSM 19306 TaxID=1121338 RepID=A0A151B6J3_9CLOT|nr:GNAT family protein [Clostridium tepidiprofundi]KYH35372.1 hypothetical protein CLTEP_07760 [Clostridium tepidiprofundi DSM 19306]